MHSPDDHAAAPLRDDMPAILREAARLFDAPVALVAPSADVPQRAYATTPVTSPTGESLGTLCVLGAPAALAPTRHERATLRALADRAAVALAGRTSLTTGAQITAAS